MTKKPKRISIKQSPEGERPREKLIQFGAELLTDAELLAILLRIGNKGASAIDMGRELIAKLRGLQGIDRAHTEEIMQIIFRVIRGFADSRGPAAGSVLYNQNGEGNQCPTSFPNMAVTAS